MNRQEDRYPPIADYALISDCHCAALVSARGSIDWCCMPRVDADSCFGRLLDWDRGGNFAIFPASDQVTVTRRYLPETMVLETCFATAQGQVRLCDFFSVEGDAGAQSHFELMRLIEGVSGNVELHIDIAPRFDYGEIIPRVRRQGNGVYTAIGSDMGMVIQSDVPLDVIGHRQLAGNFCIHAGQRFSLSVRFEHPELIDTTPNTPPAAAPPERCCDAIFERTCRWWRDWSGRIRLPYPLDEQSLRSAIVLKSLSFERTGAIVAAPTTSLPEWIGGSRNWDYRFSWVRDSVFTVRALDRLGCDRESDRFLQFVQRSSAGSAAELQIMYGVDGKRRLTEVDLDVLEGYRGSHPVRIGNLASRQNQHDIYGEILELAWLWHAEGGNIELQYWDFLVDVVNAACERWRDQDYGIWEFRDGPRHHVHSKAMCWGALEYGIRLAQERELPAPLTHWVETRHHIRETIESEGYDAQRGIFLQAFGEDYLDAALLRLPRIGFVAYDDPRMIRTTDAIRAGLEHDGLLMRYNSPDGLLGREGAFIPCTFWLVDCLARQGRPELAWSYYQRGLRCANSLGLFSEEFDPDSGQMLGNFPQALSHVSQIMARLALAETAQSTSKPA
ncbi:glycoside hydrolase family 15 protein [Noviherbaspirillum sp. UKPF54]|uniref:glycoside hydrolase family 15 protein n=1 Tax=Noviherbaspirillum sp. UKPF54 TaxID=2601898 RepID=UPI0011B1397C|nr:glycoside hydrolase family 15 protein [Noviherbaspirillum sp. UKPF54]QDZ27944.1 glycoside hydrolase family 15 protein [Noviherbaspirillum sp. UKPF54]